MASKNSASTSLKSRSKLTPYNGEAAKYPEWSSAIRIALCRQGTEYIETITSDDVVRTTSEYEAIDNTGSSRFGTRSTREAVALTPTHSRTKGASTGLQDTDDDLDVTTEAATPVVTDSHHIDNEVKWFICELLSGRAHTLIQSKYPFVSIDVYDSTSAMDVWLTLERDAKGSGDAQ